MFHPHSWIRSKRTPFGFALLSTTAVVLLWLLTAQPGFAQVTHVTNPYAGAVQYVNPDWTAEVQTAAAQQPAGSTLANQMTVVGTYPTAVWLDRMAAIAGGSSNSGRLGLAGHIQAALQQQAANGSGKPIVVELMIYDLPDRDCAALASNGEISIAPNPPTQPLSGIATYEQNYITPIANILQAQANNPNIRFVLVVEDDSLPNLVTNVGEAPNPAIANCVAANGGVSGSPSLTGVYVQAIQFALNTFHQFPNVYQYLDVGHHGWLGWTHNFDLAVPFLTQVASGTAAGLASVDGFITNTANYGPTQEPFMTATQQIGGQPVNSATFYQFDTFIDELSYASAMDQAFIQQGFPSTLGFLIDTSRNGWGGPNRPQGPSTSTVLDTFVNATKIDGRDSMGQWCNQQGAGMGVPPTVNPGGFANLNAFVWMKPPGESDGNYPGSVFNGVTSTAGDPNCDPAHSNALANNQPTHAMPNSPHAGTFWIQQFTALVQNAFPAIPSNSGPGFNITATGTTVMQGTTGSSSVTVNSTGGFSNPVNLTVSGLPTGVTAVFNPATVSGSAGSTLTFTASNTATVGPATVTVTGTSGSITQSTTLTLNVTAEPNFTISASPTALTVAPGTQSSSTVTISCVGGLTGSVSVSASNLPTGVQANFSPSSVNCPGGTVSVSFFVQNGTPASTTNVTITGTNGSISHPVTVALTIPGTGFSLSPSAPSVSLTPGGTATDTITVTPSGGFTGSVTLSASGLPTGVTATFGTNPTTSTSVLTFTAASTAASGASTITITGTSGNTTNTTTITLSVGVTQGFALTPSAPTLSVAQGASATDTITVTPAGGFTGSVTLSTSGLPTGVTATFGTNPTTSTSVLTFTAASTAASGTSTITISGVSGNTTNKTTITLTVGTTQGFTLTASAPTLSVTQGASATDTITVTPSGGFTGSVTLSASGLPTGVTATFGTNPTTSTSVLTFTAAAAATTGNATVTITGTSGTTTATTTIALTVNPANQNVTITPVINSNSPFFNEEDVKLTNTAPITALSVTISVARTTGVSFSGLYNTVGGIITQANSSTASTVTYTFNLNSGQTLNAGSYIFAAQTSGTGTAHPTSGDTFSVTYTTGGTTTTQTGHF